MKTISSKHTQARRIPHGNTDSLTPEADKRQNTLEAYLINEFENSRKMAHSNRAQFNFILAAFMGIAMAGGFLLGKVEVSEIKQLTRLRKMDVSFLMKEKKQPEPVKKKVVKPKKKLAEKPIKKASLREEVKAADKAPVRKVVRRKVYGVRKVYSRGLGSGYGGSEAVVTKLGNSLDVPPDTIRATENDLKGELVSVTKISKMPRILKAAKPEYTHEMKENQVTGKVKAKVLVDVDGNAKKIIIVKDLGYGTKRSSIQAIRKMKFKPGLRDNVPVAVWIPLTFRFELQA
jgi:outer membrane biosynthesis protein TonB